MTAVILFGSFLVFMILRAPVGVSLGFACIITIFSGAINIPMSYVAQSMVSAVDSFPILAVPFFVLAGELMGKGGISRRLLNICDVVFGRFAGGLAMVTVVCCMIFAAISGSGPATVAAIGGLTIPSMIEQGYDKKFASAIAAAAGAIGVIIPPSIPMVMYGVSCSDASVTAMFAGGILPGILIGCSLLIYCHFYCKRRGYVNKNSEKFSWESFGRTVRDGIFALIMPVIILGGIYGGFFTPTEAADVAVIYGLIVGLFIYRDLKLKDLWDILSSAALTTVTVMMVMGTATIFGRILTLAQIPTSVANSIISISNNSIVIMLLINLLLLFVGCFMDTTAAIIILTPILAPIASACGYNMVHFGIIMVVNLAIGFVTPPLGINLYVSCRITPCKLEDVSKGVLPMIGVMILDLLIITFAEGFVMFLPRLIT